MTYRVYVNINRGKMDATAVCVYPWEVPILEEIHGGGAQLTTPEEMASMKGAASVKPIQMPYNKDADKLLPLDRALVERQRVAYEDDPFHDLQSEWTRLENLYGMDKELPMPVVKKVYGSPANFAQAIRVFRSGTLPPKNIDELIHGAAPNPDEIPDDAEDLAELAPSDMTINQLRKQLKDAGIAYNARATRDELESMLIQHLEAA